MKYLKAYRIFESDNRWNKKVIKSIIIFPREEFLELGEILQSEVFDELDIYEVDFKDVSLQNNERKYQNKSLPITYLQN